MNNKLTSEELDIISDTLLSYLEDMENYDSIEIGGEDHGKYIDIKRVCDRVNSILLLEKEY